MTESTSDNGVRPNVLFVQLESFFDPIEYEDLQMSEDPIPNLRKMFENYSSGYFKVPSVGAGTANTEFEVLTGMNLRYFLHSVTEPMRFTTTVVISTAVRRYLTILVLTALQVKSL